MSLSPKTDAPGIIVIGTNHRQAPLEFRERVAFVADEMQQFLASAHAALHQGDCFMVSTCNRTEIYAFHPEPPRAATRVRQLLAEFKSIDAVADAKHFYEYHGRGAVEQLYRVAAGLDSLMLGETQIVQQIQDGFDASLRAGSLGVVGERLIASAIRCGRRARAETAISNGAIKARQHRSFLIVDIGVPRDVHPDVRNIDNVFLHDVDGLQVMIEQTLLKRRREVPKVEKIIAEEVGLFLDWHRGLQAAPVIKELRGRLEMLREQEIARHASHLSVEQRAAVEQVTRALLNKLLHRPTLVLREASSQGETGLRRIEAVRDAFGLDDVHTHADTGAEADSAAHEGSS